MAHEEYRLAAAALSVESFSLPVLSRISDTNRNTASSWFRRYRKYFEVAPAADGARLRPGRPQKQWRLRRDTREEFTKVLEFEYRGFMVGNSQKPSILDRIEQHIAASRSARAAGQSDESERMELLARGLIRVAWEDFSEHFRMTDELNHANLRGVADFEREIGLGDVASSGGLPEIAEWMANRMDDLVARGVPEAFAGAVLRARAEVRTETDRLKLTAAALAAPVWADESIANATEGAMRRCAAVAANLSSRERVSEASRAIDLRPTGGYCSGPDEAAAIVIGLINMPNARSLELSGWLAGLRISNDWRPELAPAVARGLAEAPGVKIGSLLEALGGTLREALERAKQSRQRIGLLRRKTLDYASMLVDMTSPLTYTASDEVEEIRRRAEFFAYRPFEGPSSQISIAVDVTP